MDTNVAVKAATPPGKCKEEELKMQKTCMKFIKNFTDNPESKLVIDTDYEIIRENRGKKATIYCGKYRNTICDNSVRAGETYVYTVLPKYKEHTGTPVVLPSVTLPSAGSIPDDWWRTQCSGMRSSVASASATSPSISSFFSSSSIKESLGLIAGYSGRNTVQQSS